MPTLTFAEPLGRFLRRVLLVSWAILAIKKIRPILLLTMSTLVQHPLRANSAAITVSVMLDWLQHNVIASLNNKAPVSTAAKCKCARTYQYTLRLMVAGVNTG